MSAQDPTDGANLSLAQAQAMDRMYRLQRHVYDASRRFYLLGRDRLIDELDVPEGGSVLEIGCGTGRNLVKAAQRYPTARIHGVDISHEMLKSAGVAVTRAGLTRRISIAQGDALSFSGLRSFGVQSFDRVYFSYTLSMIPPWQQALQHAVDLVATGGALHVADFGQCEGLPRGFRAGLFAWLLQFHVTPREGLPAEMERLARRIDGAAASFEAGHRGYDWHLALRR